MLLPLFLHCPGAAVVHPEGSTSKKSESTVMCDLVVPNALKQFPDFLVKKSSMF
ncbi:hypothetical protein IMZ48_32710 [Candidatus Bathyarchaeota archaeon]|nr:hypothetical protein [Candidatus Bathyarchaeota archaeon]